MKKETLGYEILYKYKESGQRKVYRINHNIYGECILKIGKCLSSNSMERMKRETEILRSIDSESFPRNYDFKYNENGEFLIIEEYIKSRPLQEVIDIFKGNEKKSFSFLLEIVDGLDKLWKMRVVHRDLKPENILVKDNIKPVIIDLGIARVLDEKSLTLTIQPNGPCTPIYASPEQWENDKESIDMRTDFYSIGIIVAEMILGEHPFSPKVVGEGISILENLSKNKYKLQYEGITLSKEGESLINRLLKRRPYERIRNSAILRKQVNEIIEGC